ncbi:MAG: VOC family protein [Chthoniobacterales bacterium]
MSDARNPVGWFEIYVQDVDVAKAFYEATLQVTLEHLQAPSEGGGPTLEMWAFPMMENAGGAAGAIVKMEGVPSGPGGTLVYFSCEDCAEEQSRAEGAGGKVFKPKMGIGEYGFMSLVQDPDGNMIGLHSMK